MKKLDIDTPAEMEAVVTDPDTGDLVDPEDPLWRVLTPSKDLGEPEVTRVSKGTYRCVFEHDEPGEHHFLFKGNGQYKVGGESTYMVKTPKVPRD